MIQITLVDRFHDPHATGGLFQHVYLILDGTDCPIDMPSSLPKDEKVSWCCGRKKDNAYSKYNFKYTVVVQVGNGKICSVIGPEKGSVTDVQMIRDHMSELPLDENEMILGDKGYQGLARFWTPFKAPSDINEEVINELHGSVRQLVECTFKRLKDFGCLGSKGRFHCDKSKHKALFNVCCHITNIKIDRDPIWHNVNWFLKNF